MDRTGTAEPDRSPASQGLGGRGRVLLNLDVPDLASAESFYRTAFGLRLGRRLGESVVELLGWSSPLYLLRHESGTLGAASDPRIYRRHWTPMHVDIVVDDIEEALSRVTAAGAVCEGRVRHETWGRIATLADPFGHGFCLIEFQNRGYDELVQAEPGRSQE